MIRKAFLAAATGAALIVAPVQVSAAPAMQAATVYYDASGASSYQAEIAQAMMNWNNSVSNVQLVANQSAATLEFYEGDDPEGSYANTDGHGNGYIFLDHTQMSEFSPVRVVAHETGHALGLEDHYEGPCSELMSGGGPGPSCTNAFPDENEIARVEELWANGRQARGELRRITEPVLVGAH